MPDKKKKTLKIDTNKPFYYPEGLRVTTPPNLPPLTPEQEKLIAELGGRPLPPSAIPDVQGLIPASYELLQRHGLVNQPDKIGTSNQTFNPGVEGLEQSLGEQFRRVIFGEQTEAQRQIGKEKGITSLAEDKSAEIPGIRTAAEKFSNYIDRPGQPNIVGKGAEALADFLATGADPTNIDTESAFKAGMPLFHWLGNYKGVLHGSPEAREVGKPWFTKRHSLKEAGVNDLMGRWEHTTPFRPDRKGVDYANSFADPEGMKSGRQLTKARPTMTSIDSNKDVFHNTLDLMGPNFEIDDLAQVLALVPKGRRDFYVKRFKNDWKIDPKKATANLAQTLTSVVNEPEIIHKIEPLFPAARVKDIDVETFPLHPDVKLQSYYGKVPLNEQPKKLTVTRLPESYQGTPGQGLTLSPDRWKHTPLDIPDVPAPYHFEGEQGLATTKSGFANTPAGNAMEKKLQAAKKNALDVIDVPPWDIKVHDVPSSQSSGKWVNTSGLSSSEADEEYEDLLKNNFGYFSDEAKNIVATASYSDLEELLNGDADFMAKKYPQLNENYNFYEKMGQTPPTNKPFTPSSPNSSVPSVGSGLDLTKVKIKPSYSKETSSFTDFYKNSEVFSKAYKSPEELYDYMVKFPDIFNNYDITHPSGSLSQPSGSVGQKLKDAASKIFGGAKKKIKVTPGEVYQIGDTIELANGSHLVINNKADMEQAAHDSLKDPDWADKYEYVDHLGKPLFDKPLKNEPFFDTTSTNPSSFNDPLWKAGVKLGDVKSYDDLVPLLDELKKAGKPPNQVLTAQQINKIIEKAEDLGIEWGKQKDFDSIVDAIQDKVMPVSNAPTQLGVTPGQSPLVHIPQTPEYLGPAGGTHGAQKIKIGNSTYIFKGNPIGSLPVLGEEYGSKIANILNKNVPIAERVNLPAFGEGTLQKMSPGGLIKPHQIIENKDQMAQNQVADWLIGNWDAHSRNFLMSPQNQIIPFDKGQSFKYWENEIPSPNYHPNAKYGESAPVYTGLVGQIDPDTAAGYALNVSDFYGGAIGDMYKKYSQERWGAAGSDLFNSIQQQKLNTLPEDTYKYWNTPVDANLKYKGLSGY